MPGEGAHTLLECRRRSAALRALGYDFEQIADLFSVCHDASPLRVHRYAYGFTAAEAAARYNDLDPAGTAALRESRLYEFEHWPQRGMRPTAHTIALFARGYRTAARRLVSDQVYASYTVRDRDLIDRTDHRPLPAHRPAGVPVRPVGHATMDGEAARPAFPAPAAKECAALLRALGAEEADVKRRDLLFELALALGGTPALVLLRHLSPPEQDRLAVAVRATARVDGATVEVIEKLAARCRRLDDDFGPAKVLPTVAGQRALVTDLLRRETLLPGLRHRLVRAYAELSQLAGWLHHDLLDHAGARSRYREGLAAAHEIRDPTLIAYLHTCLANMARFQGQGGEALDHIYAAQGWATHSPSPLFRSLHAVDLARILAMNGDAAGSERALSRSLLLAGQPRHEADPAYLYWWTAHGVERHTASCMLALRRPDEAIASAERALTGPMRKPARGGTLLRYAGALIQKREIPGATEKIREAARITVAHSSGRLTDSVRQSHARLRPWTDNKHVQALDEELRALRLIPARP
ncbi:hypothetical protein Sru01_55880 [Sphaerisporangium rufum]|uniref:XRE family transcriptional regulator n=1 Tax=Sphaerisporangium rufum TaxID=1381558 RepID=A0A919V0Z8_9ACTN|nr:hypothetical protein [Sphaerisporangium rufum]GII80606.1 hypothetical protein Sru01_55880 [Sphaerisporangium rufum]